MKKFNLTNLDGFMNVQKHHGVTCLSKNKDYHKNKMLIK